MVTPEGMAEVRTLARLRALSPSVPLVLATGRGPRSARLWVERCHAPYLVAFNGGLVASRSLSVSAPPVPRDVIEAIAGAAAGTEMEIRRHRPGEEAHAGLAQRVVAVEVVQPSAAMLDLIERLAAPGHGALTVIHHIDAQGRALVSVTAGVDKRWGVSQVWEGLGLHWSDVAAFGDGPNDVTMLAAAGVAVAVGDAPSPELLAVATHQVPLAAGQGPVGAFLRWLDGAAEPVLCLHRDRSSCALARDRDVES